MRNQNELCCDVINFMNECPKSYSELFRNNMSFEFDRDKFVGKLVYSTIKKCIELEVDPNILMAAVIHNTHVLVEDATVSLTMAFVIENQDVMEWIEDQAADVDKIKLFLKELQWPTIGIDMFCEKDVELFKTLINVIELSKSGCHYN